MIVHGKIRIQPGVLTIQAGLQELYSILAIFSILAQPFYLRHLLQHMDAQVFVQLPRVLRGRQELSGNSKFWGLARSSNSWIEKILNFR
jgi:hypothetical protein